MWWRRLGAGVLAAGALAGAVTAILQLWPDPDPADKVTISSVEVVSQPLSTFVATATIRPVGGANLINPFQALPDLRSTETAEPTAAPPAAPTAGTTDDSPVSTSSSASSSGSSATSSSSSSSSSWTSSSSSSSATTATTTSEAPETELPPPVVLDIPADLRNQFNAALHASPDLRLVALPDEVLSGPVHGPGNSVIQRAERFAVDQNGEPLPVEEAARNLAASLEQVRSVAKEGKRDPLGVRMTVDLELQGLRGVDLYLYWRLLAAGSNPVPENLAVATPAFLITPGTDLDSASVDAWVPLPEAPGPYQVELLVTDGTGAAPLDSLRSEPFD